MSRSEIASGLKNLAFWIGMLIVLKTLLIIKNGGYAVFFEVYNLHSGTE